MQLSTRQAVDRAGKPIPWYTYSAIRFLDQRVGANFRVFEYGCGNSTRWYANKVREVVSVEHNERWAAIVRKYIGPNVTLEVASEPDSYAKAILAHGYFDMVVVDGIQRRECALLALKALTEDGIIIWDNSNRPEFGEVFPILREKGFREFFFDGLAPILTEAQRTSILYRSPNCLGL